jgi:Zn-dependent protease with chaperone function
MISVIIFLAVYLPLTNWFQLSAFVPLIFRKAARPRRVRDDWISDIVLRKTGLVVDAVTIFPSDRPFALMAGLPFWHPTMVISSRMYADFSRRELEWAVLHEAGHCVLWHNVQAAVLEQFVMTVGAVAIARYGIPLPGAAGMGVLLSILTVQTIRWGIEYAADRYAISRVFDPRGVVSAQHKLLAAYPHTLYNDPRSPVRMLIHWNITPARRITMARKRLATVSAARRRA